MNRTIHYLQISLLSGILGFVSEYFGSIQFQFAILLILIIIDTATGISRAIKYDRFSSRGFRKLIKKFVLYSTCIVTVRLLEIGVFSLINTLLLSQITIAFLIITEAISILENLTLLGTPIPTKLIKIFLDEKISFFRQSINNSGQDNQKIISEIEEIINYQIPTFNDKYIKQLLKIKFAVWKNIAMQINNLIGDGEISNDHIYYKVISLIQLGLNEIQDKWKDEVPQEYINKFNTCHQPKVDTWLEKISLICYSNDSVTNKKERLVESILIILYETIIDARKGCELVN